MAKIFREDWHGTDQFQDDFNYGIASGINAFSNTLSEHPLDANSYPIQDVYQESPVESFCNSAVASNAFISSPIISPQDSITSIPQAVVSIDDFGSPSLAPYQSQVDYDDSSFLADYPEKEFVPIDPSLDSSVSNPFGEDSSKEQISFKEEVYQSAIPYSGEEEFEIEIEDSETEGIQCVSEKSNEGFKSLVGQVVESGVATAATSILSAYISPVAATAVVNTGMAAGKKVCFGIANRRAQKKITDNPYSSTAVIDSVDAHSVPKQSCISATEKSSREKTAKWKEKSKQIGIEIGKEVARQICFGIEKRRKQKSKGSASVGKASKYFSASSNPSLDYEPGGSEFGVKELLSEIDVAKIASTASSCLRKKVPVR